MIKFSFITALIVVESLFFMKIALAAPTETSSSGFHFSTSLITEANTYVSSAYEYAAQSKLSVAPSYSFRNQTSISLKLSVLQSHTEDTLTVLDNTEAAVGLKPIELTNNLTFVTELGGTLATNHLDRRNLSYFGSTSIESALIQKARIFKSPIDFIYSAAYIRNFHEFTRAADDTANLEQIGYIGAGFKKPLFEVVIISLSGGLFIADTYQGTRTNIFNISESISYVFDKKNSGTITIGHYNKASTLQSNGFSSNVALYNEATSTLYGALSYAF